MRAAGGPGRRCNVAARGSVRFNRWAAGAADADVIPPVGHRRSLVTFSSASTPPPQRDGVPVVIITAFAGRRRSRRRRLLLGLLGRGGQQQHDERDAGGPAPGHPGHGRQHSNAEGGDEQAAVGVRVREAAARGASGHRARSGIKEYTVKCQGGELFMMTVH